jgi:dTDP-4-amino-4,6-dideoxygalactose transaminase
MTRQNKIDFYRPPLGRAEQAAINRALARGWLTSGPECARFEEEMCAFLGVKHALAVSSGTAALHLGLLAADVGPGDEVITTPYTFVATAEVIAYCGAQPVFADVEPGCYTIDPGQIERKITARTKAILPVGIGGLPCRSDRIRQIARRHKLKVIEDGAHTLGATVGGTPIGRWADATAFSFYSTKNLCIGEGGMVVTGHTAWYDKMRVLSRHGISKGTWDRYGNRGWAYDVTAQGYKYNMSDLLAAIGRVQLKRFAQLQKKRERVDRWYRALAADIGGLSFPEPAAGAGSAYHLLMVRLTDPALINSRDKILSALTQRGIGISVHFIPLHLMTHIARRYGLKHGDFPEAEAAYRATMSLPFFPEMTKNEVRFVTDTLREILRDPE